MKTLAAVCRVFAVGMLVAMLSVGCSAGPGNGPVAPAAQSALAPVSWDPGAAPDKATVANIKAVVLLLESGDAASLAGRVRTNGLIIAPYAVGAPERGLTGDAAANALRAMLTGATPHVSAYALPHPGRMDLIVTGLNAVQIAPAAGEALTITSPAQVSVFSDEQGNWRLGMVAVDPGGLLNQRMGQFPFRPWPPV